MLKWTNNSKINGTPKGAYLPISKFEGTFYFSLSEFTNTYKFAMAKIECSSKMVPQDRWGLPFILLSLV